MHRFYFAADPQTNNNQTFIVNSLTNTGDIETIGFKGKVFFSMKFGLNLLLTQTTLALSTSQSSEDPEFGPYNVLMCRPGQIASFPLNEAISQSGLVVAFDFYPYPAPHGSNIQTIFSIRNTATNFISLRCDYFQGIAALNLLIFETSTAYYLLDANTVTSIPIQSGKLNSNFIFYYYLNRPMESSHFRNLTRTASRIWGWILGRESMG